MALVAGARAAATEFARAATQLGINLVGILVAALATLALQRAVWHRVPRVVPASAAVRTGAARRAAGSDPGARPPPRRTMPG